MITELNKETFAIIRQAIVEQLRPLEKTLGVKLSPAGITYGTGVFTVKVDGTLIDCGAGKNGAELEFKRLAPLFDIPTSFFGKKVVTSHGMATITAIHTANRKFPIIASLDDGSGRSIKMDVNTAKARVKL